MSSAASRPEIALLRRWLAAAVGFVILVPFAYDFPDKAAVLVPVAMPFVAAIAIQVRSLGAQLAARAAWWSNLALGAILTLTGGRSDGRYGVYLCVGAGGALLIAGRAGVADATRRTGFAPAAFKNTLLALMILALADASTFLLIGLIEPREPGMLLIVASVVLCVGFVGLYRLALWGVLVNVITSTIVAVVIGTRLVPLDKEIMMPIAILGGLQLAVAAPMLLSLVTGRAPRAIPQRVSAMGAAVLITVLMLVSVASRFRWFS